MATYKILQFKKPNIFLLSDLTEYEDEGTQKHCKNSLLCCCLRCRFFHYVITGMRNLKSFLLYSQFKSDSGLRICLLLHTTSQFHNLQLQVPVKVRL